MIRCPLCGGGSRPFPGGGDKVHHRRFHRCGGCLLIFVDRADLPDREYESSRYRLHRNERGDARYRDFLDRLASSITPHLTAGMTGLDYGSGPAPVLADLLGERGFPTQSFDPLFHPREELLAERYDFVTCSEVVEHFHEPGREFARLASLLREGGLLGVMTQTLDDWDEFPRWHYHRDVTHVAFYDDKTYRWIAAQYGWTLTRPRRDVAIFTKGRCGSP